MAYVVVWMSIGVVVQIFIPFPKPYYDPLVVFEVYKNNEEEEHHAQISDMEKLILEHMEVMREQLTEQGKAAKRMSAKLTEMMVETATCNDLKVMILANTQEEPQVEGRIDLKQEIGQFGSSIHDLQDLLNEKVEASEAQLQSVVDTSQCIEEKKESQPLDYSLLANVDVEEVDKSEDVKHNAILELGHICLRSKHFSTLCLVDNLEIEPFKPMERCIDE
ncbi:hypothetical protein HAX54_011985 [Datura stramonium]|uniref:Uncharacterized protein n=1 Tax=Datura stramonium TaxID=4076 RepID=A0ABS8TJ25_DATST|nr:hypothetical protein [Datura stramonium]